MEKQLRDNLFNQICEACKAQITPQMISSFKTSKGNTQGAERTTIETIRNVLNSLNLPYEEAGSQQSKDFRNVGGIGLNIEIKKTDSFTVIFNDTCPCEEIYYIILFTGKTYKRKESIQPQLIYLNGADFITEHEKLSQFCEEFRQLKEKWVHENFGNVKVYPRPTYSAVSIQHYLK
jgi:hypothetical protein